MRLLNLRINFYLLRTFSPHLGSFLCCFFFHYVSKTWCDRQQLLKAVITGDTVTRLIIPIRVHGKNHLKKARGEIWPKRSERRNNTKNLISKWFQLKTITKQMLFGHEPPILKTFKESMLGTAGEEIMNSWVTLSFRLLHKNTRVLIGQEKMLSSDLCGHWTPSGKLTNRC